MGVNPRWNKILGCRQLDGSKHNATTIQLNIMRKQQKTKLTKTSNKILRLL